jgi:hypothetical protein
VLLLLRLLVEVTVRLLLLWMLMLVLLLLLLLLLLLPVQRLRWILRRSESVRGRRATDSTTTDNTPRRCAKRRSPES